MYRNNLIVKHNPIWGNKMLSLFQGLLFQKVDWPSLEIFQKPDKPPIHFTYARRKAS